MHYVCGIKNNQNLYTILIISIIITAMKKTLLVLCITFIGTLACFNAIGQTASNELTLGMPEVLLLNSNSAAVNLTLTPQDAGEAVVSSVTSSAARLLISSVVSGTQTRNLSAMVTTGTIPAGTILKLQATAPNANFIGTAGTLGAEVELDGVTAKSIITAIGTCYSGTSADDGYVLKYTYGIPESTTDYGLIRASGGSSVTVTLTLSAGA